MQVINLNWNVELTVTREMTGQDYRDKNMRYIGDAAGTYAALYENQSNGEIYIEKGYFS